MVVQINSEEHQLEQSVSLMSMLERLELNNKKGIAIALNEEVIPKAQWESIELSDNDKILIIKATQGG